MDRCDAGGVVGARPVGESKAASAAAIGLAGDACGEVEGDMMVNYLAAIDRYNEGVYCRTVPGTLEVL